jgi:hypothetical protein
VKKPYVVPDSGLDCLIMFTCNLGDANRLLMYIIEKFPHLEAVIGMDTCAAVRCKGVEERSVVLKLFFADVMLEKKCDRFYAVDNVLLWSVDWPVKICDAAQLWGVKDSKFRIMAAPRKLEQEFVVAVEELSLVSICFFFKKKNEFRFCNWSKRTDLPYFSPQGFTDCVSVFNFEAPNKDKLLGWAVMKSDLVYLKPSTKNAIKEDKVSRAYFKLFEALDRFHISPKPGGKVLRCAFLFCLVPKNFFSKQAIDVGASPGGWVSCLIVDLVVLTSKRVLSCRLNVWWSAG